MKKALAVAALLLLVAVGVACGGGNRPAKSIFWDADGRVPEGGMGRWVDSVFGPLPVLYGRSDAVVVAKVESIAKIMYGEPFDTSGVKGPTSGLNDLKQLSKTIARTPRMTLYNATVTQWVKGSGSINIQVWNDGGYDEPDHLCCWSDGDVPLELGRTYIVFLRRAADGSEWARQGAGRSIFDITTGKVLVLNHPMTEDLEQYEGMTPEAFISMLQSYQ